MRAITYREEQCILRVALLAAFCVLLITGHEDAAFFCGLLFALSIA